MGDPFVFDMETARSCVVDAEFQSEVAHDKRYRLRKPLDLAGFLKLVIDALQASGIECLIGCAIAEWACGETRATQGLDLVVKIHSNPSISFRKNLGVKTVFQ